MKRIQQLDPRFSLRLRVPDDADSLFPDLFACNQDSVSEKARSIALSDVATYTGNDVESDDDEEIVKTLENAQVETRGPPDKQKC